MFAELCKDLEVGEIWNRAVQEIGISHLLQREQRMVLDEGATFVSIKERPSQRGQCCFLW